MNSRAAFLFLTGLAWLGGAQAQTTWFVDASATPPGNGSANSPFTRIQDALVASTTLDGDTIQVAPGNYAELVDFGSKSVVLRSAAGPASTTIDATGLFSLEQSVVKIRAGQGPACVLEGFTLRGGEGSQIAGGPFNGIFSGGGLLVRNASPTVRDCVVTGNQATSGAGAFIEGGNVVFERCSFLTNGLPFLYGGGGMLALDSQLELKECTFEDNQSAAFAGALLMLGGRVDAFDCTFADNTGYEGGHVMLGAFGFTADSSFTRTQFLTGFGTDGNGGALQARGGTHVLVDCTFAQNVAGDPPAIDYEGGAAWFGNAVVAIEECTFTGNSSATGGALGLRDSSATVRSCTFTSNRVEPGTSFGFAQGGALFAHTATVSVEECSFTDNEVFRDFVISNPASARGGAVGCVGAGVTIDRCTFVGNRARARLGASGATNPHPACAGGAVYGPAVIRRSTFLGHSAKTDPDSQAGYCEGGTLAQVLSAEHCTLVDSRIQGVGPQPDSGPIVEGGTLTSCIARDYSPLQLPPLGTTTSATYSNVEGGPFGIGMIDADPKFWSALAGDLHLRPGSPSQDAGDPAGAPDPDGSLPDQGALPFDPLYAPPSVAFYCLPKSSSAGCAALLSTSDLDSGPTSGQSDYEVRALGVQGGKVGLFLLGASGPAKIPALGGTLCLASPLFRLAPQVSGGSSANSCDGSLELVVNAGAAPADPGPGSEIWLQAWYRDPLNGPGALGSALSNAVALVYQ